MSVEQARGAVLEARASVDVLADTLRLAHQNVEASIRAYRQAWGLTQSTTLDSITDWLGDIDNGLVQHLGNVGIIQERTDTYMQTMTS